MFVFLSRDIVIGFPDGISAAYSAGPERGATFTVCFKRDDSAASPASQSKREFASGTALQSGPHPPLPSYSAMVASPLAVDAASAPSEKQQAGFLPEWLEKRVLLVEDRFFSFVFL